MTRSPKLVLVLAAIALAIPAASATWFVKGTYEPDTMHDDTQGWMFEDPDTSATGMKVYFNGVTQLFQTGNNPNSGHTGSRIFPFPAQLHVAFLGVWKDCNGDGFIGALDGALAEYRAELISGTTACPPQTECPPEPHAVFNCGGWVFEFIWIGHRDVTSNERAFAVKRMINDTSARVWTDHGLPGDQARQTCAINPPPAGTTGSTGGALNYFDCFVGYQVAKGVNAATAPTGIESLGFDDPTRPQADDDSALNQPIPLHPWWDPYHPDNTGSLERSGDRNDGSTDAAFTTWDCSQRTEVADPTGGQLSATEDPSGLVWEGAFDEDGVLFSVGTPAPGVRGFRDGGFGSFRDGLNNTYDGVGDGCDDQDANGFPVDVGVEGQGAGGTTVEKGRIRTASALAFNVYGTNPYAADDGVSCPTAAGAACESVPGTDGTMPDDGSQDGGLGALRMSAATTGPGWFGHINWVTTPQSVNRNTLTVDGPLYLSHYASVGEATTSTGVQLASSVVGVYGAEWCDGATTGVVRGFDCDASHWWNPLYDPSAAAMPTDAVQSGERCTTGRTTPSGEGCREIGVKPGQTYRLRDIDCHDGSIVRGVPVYASLVQISEAQGGCLDAS